MFHGLYTNARKKGAIQKMNVQSISCQPIRQAYNTRPFGNRQETENDEQFREELEAEREECRELARNKDSKVLSTIGMVGVGAVGSALAFFTFKTCAPKGWETFKKMYNKTVEFGPVKSAIDAAKRGYHAVGKKLSDFNQSIKPDSKLGKVKAFWAKNVTPKWIRVKEAVKGFCKKHNIDKLWFKKAALNTGATAAAVPAGVTAVNVNEEAKS